MSELSRRDFVFGTAAVAAMGLVGCAGNAENEQMKSAVDGGARDGNAEDSDGSFSDLPATSPKSTDNDAIANIACVVDGLRDEISSLKARITALEGETLPDYYESSDYSIMSRCMDILALNPKCIQTVMQFAFVTDFHATVYSQQFHTRALLNKVFAETNCNTFVNGGDVIDGKLESGERPTEVEFANQMRRYSSWLVPDLCSLALFAAGNHDGGASWNPTGDALMDQETLSRCSVIRRSAGTATFDPNGKCQYYVDDNYHKVRWVISNFGNTTNIGDWNSEGPHGVIGESSAEMSSFVGHALASMRDGWSAIVINHIILNGFPNKSAQVLEDICDAYNGRKTYQSDDYEADFTTCVGSVVCIIGGHVHLDWTYNTVGGIPVIIVTTDNCGAQYVYDSAEGKTHRDATLRLPGTPQEQAFDVFTIDLEAKTIKAIRIGYGEDRQWTYG